MTGLNTLNQRCGSLLGVVVEKSKSYLVVVGQVGGLRVRPVCYCCVRVCRERRGKTSTGFCICAKHALGL